MSPLELVKTAMIKKVALLLVLVYYISSVLEFRYTPTSLVTAPYYT